MVELIPLPDQAGVQMLWTNPMGFKARPGEYVKIRFPWLQNGGDEWHPYSVYLKESTSTGLQAISESQHIHSGGVVLDPTKKEPVAPAQEDLDHDVEMMHLAAFIDGMSSSNFHEEGLVMEARERVLERYSTTQIFINPNGDWSNEVVSSVQNQKHLRECWVSGPYTSPFSVARQYSNLLLVATGIGITPSLGVMGAYPGFTRKKILLWSTRDKNHLRFFAPLLNDAHLALVFYTGEEKLSPDEDSFLRTFGNIFIQQTRPKSLLDIVACVITQMENEGVDENVSCVGMQHLDDIDVNRKSSWCVFYCGGSVAIRDDLSTFTQKHNFGWKHEMFDW